MLYDTQWSSNSFTVLFLKKLWTQDVYCFLKKEVISEICQTYEKETQTQERLKQAGQNVRTKSRNANVSNKSVEKRSSESRRVRLGRRQETGALGTQVSRKRRRKQMEEEPPRNRRTQSVINTSHLIQNVAEEFGSTGTTVVDNMNWKWRLQIFFLPTIQTFKLHWYKIEKKSANPQVSAAGTWLLTRE